MRRQVPSQQIEQAVRATSDKLNRRLEEKGYGTFASTHEIFGSITEEYLEFAESIHTKDYANIREELMDIAVGCIFALACVDSATIDW